MKRIYAVFMAAVMAVLLCSCDFMHLGSAALKDPLGIELEGAAKVVFTNNKESTLRVTVADKSAIKQIAGIISRRKSVNSTLEVSSDSSDYTIVFYLPNSQQKKFMYWMGASENKKDVNFCDEQGKFYKVSEDMMDVYIVNSTKMVGRPKRFTELYSQAVSYCISQIKKEEKGQTTVAVDITSDRRMRKYTMSYEDETIFGGISAPGYDVVKYRKDGKYTYVITYVTNIYALEKASIEFDVSKVSDGTVNTYNADYKLSGSKWELVKWEMVKK
jgi:hypothetical protein